MLKQIDPLQLFILLFLAVVLVIALTVLLKQTFKQRRLMKKRKPIERDETNVNWFGDIRR